VQAASVVVEMAAAAAWEVAVPAAVARAGAALEAAALQGAATARACRVRVAAAVPAPGRVQGLLVAASAWGAVAG
jgi:hypothetical protein